MLVGMTRLERATPWSQTKYTTNCTTSRYSQSIYLFVGRDDTTRTCDPLVPNQVYYQLYYIPFSSLFKTYLGGSFLKSDAKVRLFFYPANISRVFFAQTCIFLYPQHHSKQNRQTNPPKSTIHKSKAHLNNCFYCHITISCQDP